MASDFLHQQSDAVRGTGFSEYELFISESAMYVHLLICSKWIVALSYRFKREAWAAKKSQKLLTFSARFESPTGGG